MGGAWEVGALQALAAETGWDPATADIIVGTSAGAMIGALLAGGVPPWFMVARSAGEDPDGHQDRLGRAFTEAERSAGAVFRLDTGIPRLMLGSPEAALGAIRSPKGRSAIQLIAGWLPWGLISTQPLKDTIRRAVPEGWAGHKNLWITAWDYAAGRRVVFGRKGAPQADLADAVAASCAIPGFYRPVRINKRLYVDGGVSSGSNMDVLSGQGVDLVICLSPMSSPHRGRDRWPHEMVATALRDEIGRQVGKEAGRLRGEGIKVVILQPLGADIRVMGVNPMSTRRRHEVVETAVETVGEQLRARVNRELLKDLPKTSAGLIRRRPAPAAGAPRRPAAKPRRSPGEGKPASS